MRIILFMAMSANGMVADKEGSEDFLSDKNWTTFIQLAKTHGNLMIGRRSYEAVRDWGDDMGFGDIDDVKKVVITTDPLFDVADDFSVATSPDDAIEFLQESGCDTLLLAGGPTLAGTFADAGLLDQIILNVEPVIVRNGMPLFGEAGKDLSLDLEDHSGDEGIVTLVYGVRH